MKAAHPLCSVQSTWLCWPQKTRKNTSFLAVAVTTPFMCVCVCVGARLIIDVGHNNSYRRANKECAGLQTIVAIAFGKCQLCHSKKVTKEAHLLYLCINP